MNGYRSLYDLKQGQKARVKSLLNTGSMRRRLQDLGIVEGTKVERLLASPSGDPVAYLIKGAVIALRSEDSSKIVITAPTLV